MSAWLATDLIYKGKKIDSKINNEHNKLLTG